MKGRDPFSQREAAEIRRLLGLLRTADPGAPQKVLRDRLRAMSFYICDFGGSRFSASDFDVFAREGRITIDREVTTAGRPSDSATRVSAAAGPRPSCAPRPTSTSAPPGAGKLEEWIASALSALSSVPRSIHQAIADVVPDKPGLYALFASAATWQQLGLGMPPDDRPLYVGKAEASLRSRDLGTHFATGATGRSSPRRSFAALLAREAVLDLVATPRWPANPEPRKWTHFALETRGDEQLTHWMLSRLFIVVLVNPPGATLGTVESRIMNAWRPPLNLTGVSTPWTSDVRGARSAMAENAKRWATERGLAM